MNFVGTGGYRIIKRLGGGCSFLVSPDDNPAVRLVLKHGPESRLGCARFLTAVQIWERLDHPSFPRLVRLSMPPGKPPFTLSEFIYGESMEEIRKNGTLPEPDAVECGLFIAGILKYLHGLDPPVLFCDMKPGHIIKRPDGSFCLIDLELLTLYEHGLIHLPARGTPGYSPPEQYRGEVSPQSDIFALGITVFRLVTGRPPRPPDKHDPVSPDLLEILMKATRPEPEERFQSAGEFMEELRR